MNNTNNVNTVVLDLYTYNELRDFRENMCKENIVYVCTNNFSYNHYISTDKAIKLLSDEKDKVINELSDKNTELKQKIYKFEHPENVEKTISEIKKMNIFQFLKWKLKK